MPNHVKNIVKVTGEKSGDAKIFGLFREDDSE